MALGLASIAFYIVQSNISIGNCVGIGPYVKILTSNHKSENEGIPVLHNIIEFAPVFVDDGCDLGVGSIILPGVTIGKGSIIGAGSVVTKNVPEYVIAAGIPARILRSDRKWATLLF